MNKIVREHYPVANLPNDLREGLAAGATVRVVLEVEETEANLDLYPGLKNFKEEPRKPLTWDEAAELIRQYKALGRPSVSAEEAVARIRELRDEWDY